MRRADLGTALGRDVAELAPVAGGDVNEAYRARLRGGGDVFVKTRPDAPRGAFAGEEAGLRWLGEAVDVPRTLAVGKDFLALEWIEPGRVDDERLGRALAHLHRAGAPAHGWVPAAAGRAGPERCADRLLLGSIELPAAPADSWAQVMAEQRLRPLAQIAERRGALPAGTRADLESTCARLDALLGPPAAPARLHGDLWSGNVIARPDGTPVLVDPAAHGGDREVDLAMLSLFGRPSNAFFAAYDEVFPRADAWAQRVALHQLTPLLVHAILFGGGYGARVAQIAAESAGRR